MFAFFYSIFGFLFRILYSFINNYGLALLIFTLFFRLIIMPTNIKQQKSSATQVRMQPKLKRIREKYQDYTPQERNQKIQEETNELYQREGYNAMAGSCMPLLFQLPILWGLYGVVREPLKYVLQIPTELLTALHVPEKNREQMLAYAARLNHAYFSGDFVSTDDAWSEDPAFDMWKELVGRDSFAAYLTLLPGSPENAHSSLHLVLPSAGSAH